ncbi:MAG: tyrosine-type recombinase/integrase [Halobacteriovoraceae bacterium]|jgi:integrase/recombinase XerD|nr:tyrosine-type recombinase/integrase [Halobacteriovoraceae bacterium]
MNSKLREQMVYELELRALDEKTQKAYINSVERLVRFYNKSPDALNVKDIREYQHYLLTEKKYKNNSVNRHLAGIRFFYKNVLHRSWYVDALPRVKGPKLIPIVLSEQEVSLMINSINSVFYKAVLMVMYSSGLRNTEVRNLKISDIDNQRNLINVRCGKGKKDRQALLSPLALSALRTYWRLYRVNNPVQSDHIFIPNKNSYNGELKKSLSNTALA